MAPQFLQILLLESLAVIMLSGTWRFMIALIFVILSRAWACSIVLGKPSRIKPFLQSSRLILSFKTSITISSGTSWPLLRYFSTFLPVGVPCFIVSLKMSPVAIAGMPSWLWSLVAYVPFPEPGGPKMMSFIVCHVGCCGGVKA